MEINQSLIATLNRIADRLGALDHIAGCLGGGGMRVQGQPALVGVSEEFANRYAVGEGEVRKDGKGLSVQYEVFDASGERVGSKLMSGVVEGAESPEDLGAPKMVRVKFGETGKIENLLPTVLLKATYDFGSRGSMTVLGKGTSQLIQLANGTTVLADAATTAVAGGTGVYEGARGIVSIIGLVTIEAGGTLPFGSPGAAVKQSTVETFRVFSGAAVARA